MKSSKENEVLNEENDELDIEENPTEDNQPEVVENVRNYSSSILSKKLVIALVIVIIVLVAVYFAFFHSKKSKEIPVSTPIPATTATPAENSPPAAPSIIFSSATQSLDSQIWKDFDVEGKFKIIFPGDAKREIGDLEMLGKAGLINFDSYSVNIEDNDNYTVFFANVLNFPPNFVGGDDAILAQTLKQITSLDENAKLISSTPTSYDNHKATDFLLQTGDVWLKGRIVVDGKTAYALAEGYFEKNYNEGDFNKFINSFMIYSGNTLAK